MSESKPSPAQQGTSNQISLLTDLSKRLKKEPVAVLEWMTIISTLTPEGLNANLDSLLKLALRSGDRTIYHLFHDKAEQKFSKFSNASSITTANEACLHLINQLLTHGSSKEIILFLNENALDLEKSSEKSFLIIEIMINLVDKLDKRELFLESMLPMILKIISEGIQRYIKRKEAVSDKPLTYFYKNFEKYVINIIKRLLLKLKALPEIKSEQKNLLTISDCVTNDLNSVENSVKSPSPKTVVKHLALVFIFDIIEGLLEALESPQHFEPGVLKDFFTYLMKTILDIHGSYIEILENYLQQLAFYSFSNRKQPENIRNYDVFYRYNSTAMAYILIEVVEKNQLFHIVYSTKQQIRISVPIIKEFLDSNKKCGIRNQCIAALKEVAVNAPESAEKNLSVYGVAMDSFLLQLLEWGGGLNADNEGRINSLDVFRALLKNFVDLMQVQLIKEIILKTKNLSIVGFLFTELKKLIQEDQKAGVHGQFSRISTIRSFLNIGAERYAEMPLATRVEIFSHMFNLILFLILRFKSFWSSPDAKERAASEVPHDDHLLNSKFARQFLQETAKNLVNLRSEFENEINDMKKQRESQMKEEEEQHNLAKENELALLVDNINRIAEVAGEISSIGE